MSEYFKAAARCDITVVRNSPVAINEKDIIEEELKARQFDTLARHVLEDAARQPSQGAILDGVRQRENEERMKAIRLDSKRKEAIGKKELERQVKEEEKRRREEELELKRLAKVEEERGSMVAERQAAAMKAQQKHVEAAQRRLRRAAPKSVEEQALELPEDEADLSYMERMRMEKERLGRMEVLYEGNHSIKALYGVELPKLQSPTQLQREITVRREQEAARLRSERAALMQEEEAENRRLQAIGQQQRAARKMSHEEWLARCQAAEREEQTTRTTTAAQKALLTREHPVDVMHRQVQAMLLAEREAEGVLANNLRAGYSHLDRLEEVMEVERDAWREQHQTHCEAQQL